MKAVSPTSRPKDISRNPIPQGFCPEGVAQTYFDNDLLYLIEHAIPSSIGGQKVFAHLLYYATLDPKTTMQYSLLGDLEEYGDEAIVLINSIEALARSEGSPCAPESYHKVLLAFEAMQVIRRKFHRDYTEIRIPLGSRTIHIPTILQRLHQMYKKHANRDDTNKFQRFALRVAARIKSGEFDRYNTFSSKVVASPSHQAVAQVLVNLLQEHNVQEVRIPSLNEACELIAQAVQSGRVRAKVGESAASPKAVIRESGAKVGESVIKSSEFVEGTSEEKVFAPQQVGEFVSTDSPTLTIFHTRRDKSKGKTRLLCLKKGEVEAIFATDSPESAELGRFSADSGESVVGVSLSDHISLDKITCNRDSTINDATLNDSPTYKDPRPIEAIRHEAADLAERLDGSRKSRWFPRFVKAVQCYPPHVRRLAEIDVLYHSAFPDYRGKPERPGAVFFRRCEEYANPQFKAIDQIRQWDLSGMNLVSIHEELQHGRPIPSATMLPFPDEAEDSVQPETPRDEQEVSASLGERHAVFTWQENQELAQHSLLNTRMGLDQAQALCNQIRRETRAFCEQMREIGQELDIQAEVYDGDREGEFVVVTVWDGNEEEWANAAKWNRYFEEVKKCYQS